MSNRATAARGVVNFRNRAVQGLMVGQMTLGRDICGDWDNAIRREWLVTNGLGGYACGTVALANSRRYHAFLMASLAPPVERTLMVAKVDVCAEYLGRRYALSPNEFDGGAVDPRGFIYIESFDVHDAIPTWRYALADALLELRIFMAPGANSSYLCLNLVRASGPVQIELKPLVTYRPMHSHGRGARPFIVQAHEAGCIVTAFEGARPLHLTADAGRYTPVNEWYWNFFHREEAARGLDALEDLFVPGVFTMEIRGDEPVFFCASAEAAAPQPVPALPSAAATQALTTHIAQSRKLRSRLPKSAPPWIKMLASATDQFIVRRGDEAPGSTSIIAGYPWFADWGRDTMIALPGLAIALARYDDAADILRTFTRFVDRGMLPNRFPDEGTAPEYNTADATLWFFQAIHEYLLARSDPDLARDLFPTLMTIIRAHADGTRYRIVVDPSDGLLCAGESGVQVTWMDAKHGDHVFTPRVGKPVEINALWLNALDATARIAGRLRNTAEKRYCETLLARATTGFSRFWNPLLECLYDVIDVDGGATADSSVRPNQILAVSLPYCTLTGEQMRAVVERCARDLVTSYGMRSLSPADPHYLGRYGGDGWQRDAAYHQGTVWAWLLGPFARAHYRAYGDALQAQAFLAPIAEHMSQACVGSVSEIFDGDAPHIAAGCFAQAWSVAEILRSWIQLERQIQKP
jgi:predicted glycogen debranching enzyme